ncbi:glutathione-specific gamma-glutamylcyclotransferase 1-like [Anneissia japonica]|uniref:glutathione-specific gamma-glutamylcyclotransferase 1-like n=1 Tax=Anneissia japonica TaxID=1529436 RepID=UPI0014259983|nr:glutathione-specific gamma-glutamylcyclotransferase 1-like [Anneissia japonica]
MAPQNHVENPDILLEEDCIWVFGYGSLVWKPDFKYTMKQIGCLKGFVRRFWQGSVTHRGYPGAPGRVATLIEKEKGLTWGVAFKIEGEKQIQEALEKLNCRECVLGGYIVQMIDFFPNDGTAPFKSLVFRATPNNDLYLGEATEAEIAQQVVTSHGFSGPNSEYVTRLAEFMETELPEVEDCHLYQITAHVRMGIKKNNLVSSMNIDCQCSPISTVLTPVISKWMITKEYGNVSTEGSAAKAS